MEFIKFTLMLIGGFTVLSIIGLTIWIYLVTSPKDRRNERR